MIEDMDFWLYDRKAASLIPTIKHDTNERVLTVLTGTLECSWVMDDMEVEIVREAYKVRLGLKMKGHRHHKQNWFFHPDELKSLVEYFTSLGFPTENHDPMNMAKYE